MLARSARLGAAACAALFGAQAGAQDAPGKDLPVAAPAWWGGQFEEPEAGFDQIIRWCKGVAEARGAGAAAAAPAQSLGATQRMVISADRTLAILGQVARPVRSNIDPRMARRLASAQKQADRLRLKKFCLRAAWIARSPDLMQRVVALEGLDAIRADRGDVARGRREGSIAIQGTLPAGVAFKDYEHEGVAYSVALFRGVERVRDVQVSFGDNEVGVYSALGALRCGPGEGGSVSQVLAWALARSKSPVVIRAAFEFVGRGPGDTAAAQLLWRALKGVVLQLPTDERARASVERFLQLAGVEDSCAGRDARGVAAWLRERGLDGLGYVVLDASGPVALYALHKDGAVRILRDRLLDQIGRSGRPRSDDRALDWHGAPIDCPAGLLSGSATFAAPVYDVAQADWLLVRAGEAVAEVFEVVRVRVPAGANEGAADVARRAVVQYIMDQQRWATVSAFDIAAVLAEQDLQRFVAFQVAAGSATWEVDLLPTLARWLDQQAAATAGTFRLVESEQLAGLDVVKRLGFQSWSESPDAAAVELHIDWEVGEQEEGKDTNVKRGRATDWVRLPLTLRCAVVAVASGHADLVGLKGAAPGRLERTTTTAKTYGGHDPRRRLPETVGEGLAAVSAELEALMGEVARAPTPVTVWLSEGVAEEVRQRLQTYGAWHVSEPEPEPEPESEPRAQGSIEKQLRVHCLWPGGRLGLQRALSLCAGTQAFAGIALDPK